MTKLLNILLLVEMTGLDLTLTLKILGGGLLFGGIGEVKMPLVGRVGLPLPGDILVVDFITHDVKIWIYCCLFVCRNQIK